MRSAIFYLQTIKLKSEIVRRDCCGSRGDIRSLTQACSEPVHCLLAACCQPVLERNKLLGRSIKPRKRRKEIAPALILALDFEFFIQNNRQIALRMVRSRLHPPPPFALSGPET
jgi:hypothetical protein